MENKLDKNLFYMTLVFSFLLIPTIIGYIFVSYVKSLEDKDKKKLLSLNKYVNDNITQEKIDVAIPNLISVIQALNDNEDAIKIVKGESKFKAETLVEALYKTFK